MDKGGQVIENISNVAYNAIHSEMTYETIKKAGDSTTTKEN